MIWDPSGGSPLPFIIALGDPQAARQAFDRNVVTWPAAVDANRQVATQYRIETVPAGYLLDDLGYETATPKEKWIPPDEWARSKTRGERARGEPQPRAAG